MRGSATVTFFHAILSNNAEKNNTLLNLKSALMQYKKEADKTFTWQSKKSLSLYEQLADIADGKTKKETLNDILNNAHLNPQSSRLAKILRDNNLIEEVTRKKTTEEEEREFRQMRIRGRVAWSLNPLGFVMRPLYDRQTEDVIRTKSY